MNQELTTDEEILTWLRYYGIHEHVEIEEEAKPMILVALRKDIDKIYVDEEGGLNIEFLEE